MQNVNLITTTNRTDVSFGTYRYSGEVFGKVAVSGKIVWRGLSVNSSLSAMRDAMNHAVALVK